jgi:antitoxin (DNA-binding transcriptional repressor) of toxin-antitoxin stability system
MKKEVAISEFKSHCLEILSNLEKSQSSIIITKRNKPIATVSAFPKGTPSIFGMFKNQIEIKGDIVAPIGDEWEADK